MRTVDKSESHYVGTWPERREEGAELADDEGMPSSRRCKAWPILANGVANQLLYLSLLIDE